MNMDFSLGNIIVLVSYAVTFIVGYAKLHVKVQQHSKQIKNIIDARQKKQEQMKKDFNYKLECMNAQMTMIKQDVKQIAKQLAKMNGMLEIYIRKEN